MTAVVPSLVEQVAQLERDIMGYLLMRPGRLVALTVALPSNMCASDLIALLRQRLARTCPAPLDIRTVASDGPARVVAAELER